MRRQMFLIKEKLNDVLYLMAVHSNVVTLQSIMGAIR
ncbi:hypothetical protein JOC58_000093 [Paenibacillus hunanensis]|uniref:Uncharacterized protein n=1 Tax=Paenibacillus hunanensis TaxID=539262 RepID=A0ABU1ISR0_9BACL|nr:hypothetical protein [Paenibacillus hunanensis]